MKKPKAKDVDSYIAEADGAARATLHEVRQVIKSAIPKAEESISWNVPFYRYHGHLTGFAAYKKHVSFGMCGVLPTEERQALEAMGYTTGNKTIQIRFDQKVPAAAIKRLLKARAKMKEVTIAMKADKSGRPQR